MHHTEIWDYYSECRGNKTEQKWDKFFFESRERVGYDCIPSVAQGDTEIFKKWEGIVQLNIR